MLFTPLDACSLCYNPSVISIPKDHLISGMDCCRHIVHTVDYLMEHGCLDSDITGNPVHIVVSDIPEATLHRTAEDINRIVFYGKEFERKLALLGIHRIKQEQTLFYLRYLQMCYFLYLMDYIIYPDVRFFNLFKENNLSYWKPYFWSDTYFISSVLDTSQKMIEHYIRSQGKKTD